MKNKINLFIPFICAFFLIACAGNNNESNKSPSAEVKDIADSNKNSDNEFRKQIIGIWSSFETVRGETIVFDANGKYSGYNGRVEFMGKWEIKDHKINLDSAGLFYMDIKVDTLYLDSTKYMRQPPALTDKNK